MRFFTLTSLFFISTSVISGCKGSGCDASVVPAFELYIYDNSTGAPLCGVQAKAIDGSYEDPANSIKSGECSAELYSHVLQLAFEREGTYQLVVEKQGYQTWTSEGNIVSIAGCHVDKRSVDVHLEME